MWELHVLHLRWWVTRECREWVERKVGSGSGDPSPCSGTLDMQWDTGYAMGH